MVASLFFALVSTAACRISLPVHDMRGMQTADTVLYVEIQLQPVSDDKGTFAP